MHIVAPLVITLGLSFVLYREKGKWNPIDLWPKQEYDHMSSIVDIRAEHAQRTGVPMTEYTESAYTMPGAPGHKPASASAPSR